MILFKQDSLNNIMKKVNERIEIILTKVLFLII